MAKLPVGGTIAAAYRFAFGSFADLIGITWLPSVIMLVFSYVINKMMLPAQPAVTAMVTPHGRALLYVVPIELVAFAMIVMMITGVAQQALGLRTGSPRYYFSFGKPAWRLIGAYLLVILTFILVSIALLLVVGVVAVILGVMAFETGAGKTIATSLVAVVAVFGIYGFMIYALARLTFFITPATIAEGRISLTRAWTMGKGNFWRIVLIGLVVGAPILAALLVYSFAFIPHDVWNFPAPGAGPAAEIAYRQMIQAQTAVMESRTVKYWYVLDPVYLVFNTIAYGLVTGSQCFGYRAVAAQERAI